MGNYFKVAVRNLLRNRVYTLINVSGLAVGIGACILMFLLVRFELSFNESQSKRDRIVRVVSIFQKPDGTRYSGGVPFPVADALRSESAQTEQVADLYGIDDTQISIRDTRNFQTERKFKEDRGVFFAEPQLVAILDFTWLAGDPSSALALPQNVVLSRSTADRYFGDWKIAMGRTILYRNREAFTVAGIIEDYPANSDFPFNVLLSFASFKNRAGDRFTDWISVTGSNNCYVLLPPGGSAARLDAYLASLVKRHKSVEYQSDGLATQSLTDLHFDSRFGSFAGSTFPRELIIALSLVGVFLLLTACVNFINLATAQAVNRSREVGVRKVLGGDRTQLMTQFLAETGAITILAVLAGIAVAEMMLPLLNQLLALTIRIDLAGDPGLLLFLAATVVVVTVLSGFYPALVLSGFNPIAALRSKSATGPAGGITLRRVLVVLQFTIAQVLIVGMLVVVSQMEFIRNASLGFNKESVLTVPVPNDSLSLAKIDVLKNRLLGLSGVSDVSFSTFSPSDDFHWNSDFKFDRSAENTDFNADLKWADADFFRTFGMQFVAGRPYQQSDTVREFVVNEALVRKLGLSSPQDILGKRVRFWNEELSAPVVGVVKDFQSSPLRRPLAPVILACWRDTYQLINIRLRPGPAEGSLASIERLWNETYPEYVYEYQFLDEKIDRFYRSESRLSQLFEVFAGIAVFISCLGLYGLVSFMAARRTKEVGIRKVLGATVSNIILLLSREFALLIAVAFVIAAPIAYFVMNQWLERFAYRVHLGPEVFLIAVSGTLVLAWLSVGYQAFKTAVTNPVETLRYE